MRIKSDVAPPGAFVVEPMPGQPGKVRVRFFENAEKVTERTHWEFDEYRLVLDEADGIDGVVMGDYSEMLEHAKCWEDQSEDPPNYELRAARE